MKPIRVLLADDNLLVRLGIRALLETVPDVNVVGEASTGAEALSRMAKSPPDLVLLDIVMKDFGGLEALPHFAKDYPEVKVIILSGHANLDYVLRAMRTGAAGYVVKDTAPEELPLAIHEVTQGKTYLSPSISRMLLQDYFRKPNEAERGEQNLTARQREVLTLTAEGQNTKQIASKLGISIKTVEAHRAQLMSRLGIHDIAGLVRYAIRTGLVSAER